LKQVKSTSGVLVATAKTYLFVMGLTKLQIRVLNPFVLPQRPQEKRGFANAKKQKPPLIVMEAIRKGVLREYLYFLGVR
jgi:hypothetical protein